MDKELDTELSEKAEETSEKEQKSAIKSVAKSDNKGAKKDGKPSASKKPKKSIVKFFKDAKSEFKKVSWPSPKQVANNTTVVMVMIIGTMLAIWGLDSLFLKVLRFTFQID